MLQTDKFFLRSGYYFPVAGVKLPVSLFPTVHSYVNIVEFD